MSGSEYIYTDSGTDFATLIWGRTIIDASYNTYGHQYRETVTLKSPKGRTAVANGSRSTTHTEATAALAFDRNDLGDYKILAQPYEFCPYVSREWPLALVTITVTLGWSHTCWNWQGRPIRRVRRSQTYTACTGR